MAGRGYVKFYRSIWEHPAFPNEPFTRREAWTWLISKAAWRATRVRAGEHIVDLERGEVPGAVRYLAAKWQWSKGKVERFLDVLKNEGMVETRSGTGITIITICNYNSYQGESDDDGTAAFSEPGQDRDAGGTGSGHERDAGGDNRKETNNSRKEEGKNSDTGAQADLLGGEGAPARRSASRSRKARSGATDEILRRFEQFWERCPVKNGKDRAFKFFLEIITGGKATFDQLDTRMDAFRVEEEAKFTAGRYRQPWQYTREPTAWLRDGHYLNKTDTIAAPAKSPEPARMSRAESATYGMLSDLTEEDFRERSR